MLKKIFFLFQVVITLGLFSAASSASDDFDCYSPDQRIWISGKTYTAEDGQEKFLNDLQVSVNGHKVATISTKDLSAESTPSAFKYLGDFVQLEVNHARNYLYFVFIRNYDRPYFFYEGQVICE